MQFSFHSNWYMYAQFMCAGNLCVRTEDVSKSHSIYLEHAAVICMCTFNIVAYKQLCQRKGCKRVCKNSSFLFLGDCATCTMHATYFLLFFIFSDNLLDFVLFFLGNVCSFFVHRRLPQVGKRRADRKKVGDSQLFLMRIVCVHNAFIYIYC